MKVLKLFSTTIVLGTCLDERRNIRRASIQPLASRRRRRGYGKCDFFESERCRGSPVSGGARHAFCQSRRDDFKNIAVMRDDAGNSYVPVALENKGSGHHREAIVSFPKISPESKRIELVIKDIAGVKERTFV